MEAVVEEAVIEVEAEKVACFQHGLACPVEAAETSVLRGDPERAVGVLVDIADMVGGESIGRGKPLDLPVVEVATEAAPCRAEQDVASGRLDDGADRMVKGVGRPGAPVFTRQADGQPRFTADPEASLPVFVQSAHGLGEGGGDRQLRHHTAASLHPAKRAERPDPERAALIFEEGRHEIMKPVIMVVCKGKTNQGIALQPGQSANRPGA